MKKNKIKSVSTTPPRSWATNKMAAAVERSNMKSVKVAQMMLKAGNEKLQDTAKKLDTIGAKQRDLRKRLHDHDMKDVPPA